MPQCWLLKQVKEQSLSSFRVTPVIPLWILLTALTRVKWRYQRGRVLIWKLLCGHTSTYKVIQVIHVGLGSCWLLAGECVQLPEVPLVFAPTSLLSKEYLLQGQSPMLWMFLTSSPATNLRNVNYITKLPCKILLPFINHWHKTGQGWRGSWGLCWVCWTIGSFFKKVTLLISVNPWILAPMTVVLSSY